jgi:hypothetical protein
VSDPEDRDSVFLRNIGVHRQYHTVSEPRRPIGISDISFCFSRDRPNLWHIQASIRRKQIPGIRSEWRLFFSAGA